MTLSAIWRTPRLPLLTSIAFTSIASASVNASPAWSVRTWQSEEGLPNNNINGLAQTADGYLWIATPVGLVRFDGVLFEPISSTNFIAPPDRGIMALQASQSGGLWLAMDRGAVAHLRSDTNRVFTSSNGLPDMLALTLVEGNDGTIWIAYNGGTLCSLNGGQATTWTAEQGGLPWSRVSSVAKDTQGTIWLARNGHVGVVRGRQFHSLLQVDVIPTRIAPARAGGIWICAGTRLLHYQEDRPAETLAEFQPAASGAEPTVLLEDSLGAVWVGTSFGGLFRYDGSSFEKIPTSHPEILNLLEDREGNIWVGTRGGGLDRLRPRAVHLETTETGLPFASVQSVCEDTAGTLWGVTENGVLIRQTADGWQSLTNKGALEQTANCVVADPAGGVWIGTRKTRLFHSLNGRFQNWDKSRGLNVGPILSLLASRSGDLWIAGQDNTLQYLRSDRFYSVPLPENARVLRALTEDAAGNIWVGTSRGMLLRVAQGQVSDETERTFAPLKSIRTLHATPDGSLWIGYAGWGVGRLKDGRFAIINGDHGLFDNYISQIVADGQGWLWFGSDHGIFKVRLQELDRVAEGRAASVRSIHYGRSEGLRGLQANFGFTPGALRDRGGRIWIATRSALAAVNPEKPGRDLKRPPVLLKRVAVDERTLAVWRGPVSDHPGADLQTLAGLVRLPPGHRKLAFEFTALSFTAPENVRFQHRLEGFDEGWIEGTERSASYGRVPAGNYRFQVRASNGNGIWNETGTALALVVEPFAWQTWWFQASALLAFCTSVIVVVRYAAFRRLRFRLIALEQQAALDRERARIARDIHDDLGGRLTELELQLEAARKTLPEHLHVPVRKISSTVRQMGESLDEIVWAVNPRHDTLPHLISYLGQFAIEFLQTAGVRCRIDLPDAPPQVPVLPEVRHNLFLAVKEALNNIARHANATESRLRVSMTNTSLNVLIEDNGKGFDGTAAGAGTDGLRNMAQRMEEMGGRFQVEHVPATGTRISLVLPWPPRIKTNSAVSTTDGHK